MISTSELFFRNSGKRRKPCPTFLSLLIASAFFIYLYRNVGYFVPNLLQSHIAPSRTAVVCNLQSERYVDNALVLGYTLRKHNTHLKNTDFILLIPHEHDMTPTSLSRLAEVGWQFRTGDDIHVAGIENLQPNYRRNFMKLHVWTWTEYKKIAVIDADCMCMGDISLLLSDKFDFGVVQDTWPWTLFGDNFNAGVMSLKPSVEMFDFILNATTMFPLGGNAEQGLLNDLFSPPYPEKVESAIFFYTPLPHKYNLNLEMYRSFRDAWDERWPDARIIHFTVRKPWPRVEGNRDLKFPEVTDVWDQTWTEMTNKYKWTIKMEETKECASDEYHWCRIHPDTP